MRRRCSKQASQLRVVIATQSRPIVGDTVSSRRRDAFPICGLLHVENDLGRVVHVDEVQITVCRSVYRLASQQSVAARNAARPVDLGLLARRFG